jgi:hypothetical protein
VAAVTLDEDDNTSPYWDARRASTPQAADDVKPIRITLRSWVSGPTRPRTHCRDARVASHIDAIGKTVRGSCCYRSVSQFPSVWCCDSVVYVRVVCAFCLSRVFVLRALSHRAASQTGDSRYKVTESTKISELLQFYCQRHDDPMDTVTLKLNGKPLPLTATAKAAGLADLSVIRTCRPRCKLLLSSACRQRRARSVADLAAHALCRR